MHRREAFVGETHRAMRTGINAPGDVVPTRDMSRAATARDESAYERFIAARMEERTVKRMLCRSVGVLPALLGAAAAARRFPVKPVCIVVPLPPGGTSGGDGERRA